MNEEEEENHQIQIKVVLPSKNRTERERLERYIA
jgi:hypothetical protein